MDSLAKALKIFDKYRKHASLHYCSKQNALVVKDIKESAISAKDKNRLLVLGFKYDANDCWISF